jgi:hypothetical protein
LIEMLNDSIQLWHVGGGGGMHDLPGDQQATELSAKELTALISDETLHWLKTNWQVQEEMLK